MPKNYKNSDGGVESLYNVSEADAAIAAAVGGGAPVVNSVSLSGNTPNLTAANVTGNDIVLVDVTSVTGDLFPDIDADPGGGSAYTIGTEVHYGFSMLGTARVVEPNFQMQGVQGFGMKLHPPEVSTDVAPQIWVVIFRYIGGDVWVASGSYAVEPGGV